LDFLTDQAEGFYCQHLLQFCGRDPHKIPITLTSRYFDPYAFISLNPASYVCTFDAPAPSWFQIEVIPGRVCVNGYRLKKHEALRMKQWTIRGSNDSTIEMEHWTVIHKADEGKDAPLLALYTCPLSEPYKFLRLVMDSPGWNARTYLAFWHFEVFGYYISD
jgi:hypothetical protein